MENLKYRQSAFLPGAVVICILLTAVPAIAQSSNTASSIKRICPINQPLPPGLKVRSVKVLGRRGDGPVEQQLEAEKNKLPNREYTKDFHQKAMEIVELALTAEANQSFEKQLGILGGARTTKLGIATIYTTPCVEIENDEVDVIVRVLFIRVDIGNPANNLLTLPRSLLPSFYQYMPAFLRAFNPNFDVDYDRRTGPVAAVKLSTNLAELPFLLSGKEDSDDSVDEGDSGDGDNEDTDGPHWRADLDFMGRKSFTERFYQTKGNLALTRLRPSRLIEKLDAVIGFHATDEPLTEMRRVKNGLTLGALIKLRPHGPVLSAVHFSADYSRNVNKVFESGVQLISERDSRGSFRSVLDGRIKGGFARAGVWFDTTEISRTATSYRRLASAFGYQKEIGAGTQTLGVEALFGMGKSWGDVPIYARFYGGSNTANFLYEAPDSPLMIEFPTGPVLRSYGQTQAGVGTTASGSARGGRSYWHANVNVAIPVRRWSQPLIPREVVVRTDPVTGARTEGTLSEMLEGFSIGTAVGGIGDNLLDGIIEELMRNDPSLTEDEAAVKGAPLAEARATEIVEHEIAPAVRFIARRANLFAVKPLLMFDVASIGGVEGERRRVRFAAGGGVQLVVVIARAELGYMKSLPQIANEPKGNFVFKITFQNLF